ncbi:hypothetical protein EWZ91_05795 [Helicobacter pylori]|nr:hypothetical protein [Helicobacter pylori]OPG20471.1 hypothetical protein BGL62_06700 [Helicobacter pylori]QEF33644.1 hypothetical protein D2C79_03280 [Helicobacter pylori]
MGIFSSVILKLFKMGFFCFVILKFVLKNISNSFYKGIGWYFEIILPLTIKYPLTQEDRLKKLSLD